jgi:hypothetical protein
MKDFMDELEKDMARVTYDGHFVMEDGRLSDGLALVQNVNFIRARRFAPDDVQYNHAAYLNQQDGLTAAFWDFANADENCHDSILDLANRYGYLTTSSIEGEFLDIWRCTIAEIKRAEYLRQTGNMKLLASLLGGKIEVSFMCFPDAEDGVAYSTITKNFLSALWFSFISVAFGKKEVFQCQNPLPDKKCERWFIPKDGKASVDFCTHCAPLMLSRLYRIGQRWGAASLGKRKKLMNDLGIQEDASQSWADMPLPARLKIYASERRSRGRPRTEKK